MAAPASEQTEVLVVGAGPSGLMAALCLTRLGVRATLVDGKAGPTRESRALALQARSMEIYAQLGLVDRVLAEADRSPRLAPGFATRSFRPLDLDAAGERLTPYPGVTVLEQSRNERILAQALLEADGDLRWRHELRELRIDTDGAHPVEASIAAPEGVVRIRARWVIAADGAGSPIRTSLGIPFEGSTNPLRFFVTDALDAQGLVEGAVNLRASRERVLLSFPMGGPGHHRILGILEGEDSGPALEERVRARLRTDFGVVTARSAWFSTYHVHHRLAARFREGPAFLIGDAAHVHSPVGAQGMNTGLQDAHNLACALAEVVRDGADERRLDRYEAERRPVARRLVTTTDALFERVTSQRRLARLVRGRIVPLLAPLATRLVPRLLGRERLYGYLAQLRIHYPLDATRRPGRHGRRDPIVGRRLAWTGENFDVLAAFRWQVHGYGTEPERVASVAARLGLEGHAFGPDRFGRLSPQRLYLVRPDGFVAAAARPEEAEGVFRGAANDRPGPTAPDRPGDD